MQASRRSSRLASLAKCPKGIIILNSVDWVRYEWLAQ